MPKRSDIKTILVIGAGPIIIGQGCEFDYSGTQACSALKEEGYRVILINPNPATIMTDPEICDSTYIEPMHWEEISKIIEIERPDAILPTVGGQVALNMVMDLHERKILSKFNIELIGASITAIKKAEERGAFSKAALKVGLEIPNSLTASNLNQAINAQQQLGLPLVIRPSFTLGGSGGGVAHTTADFNTICEKAFALSPTHSILIEEYLWGWKEFEMEVIRDKEDNCIVICALENVDPMGIHTGDSIVVSPVQTLTDKEYQKMRNASFALIREIGVETGGANVQFAINPKTGRMVVIEMNPRVSRSSALASKATGYPIAKIAAKLAIGYALHELKNDIVSGKTACFEPTIDYVVTKIPRFDFKKLTDIDEPLGIQMKSIGEAMAIGRSFQESLQKALRSLETNLDGLASLIPSNEPHILNFIEEQLRIPGCQRIYVIADAFRNGMILEKVHELTGIDPWFLREIQHLVNLEYSTRQMTIKDLTYKNLLTLKKSGFSDNYIASLLQTTEEEVRCVRYNFNIHPVYKRIDGCAAEFPTATSYFYSTYEQFCESLPTKNKKIIILGSGPNRIGQGIEFDYCCVHAAIALREYGYETIMVNCNPETVSTNYDISDRLYLEPLKLENILEIINIEKPAGVVIQYGGQTPLKLAKTLGSMQIPILGTSSDAIDRAEDRKRFKQLIQKLNLKQPKSKVSLNMQEAINDAKGLGYPIIVRPSYVIGGESMKVIYKEKDLKQYLNTNLVFSNKNPVLIDQYLKNAIEIDVDAISDGNEVFIAGILEQIEPAGIHSGDSVCSLPPHSVKPELQEEMCRQVKMLAIELAVMGPINVQFAILDEAIYVLEVNPRISRTVPFISKAIGLPVAKIGIRCMLNKSLKEQGIPRKYHPKFFSVKRPIFSFNKFKNPKSNLGPEMKSTGEIMSISNTFEMALLKSKKTTKNEWHKQDMNLIAVNRLQDLHKKIEEQS